MHKLVNRRLHKTIAQIEYQKIKKDALVILGVTASFVYLYLIVVVVRSEDPMKEILEILLLLLVFYIIYFSFKFMSWHEFKTKELYYSLGVCITKNLIIRRYRDDSNVTVVLPDNTVLNAVLVSSDIVEKCEIDDSLLLIFDEKSNKVPIKIYTLESRLKENL